MEWPDIVREMVEDRQLAIETAIAAAKKLNAGAKLEGSDVVSWRDLAPLPTPERVTVALSGDTGETSNGQTAGPARQPAER